MPHWDDTSPWLKGQLAVMAFDNWEFLTFNIHLHPELESKWGMEGKDVRTQIRDRLRHELDRGLRQGVEHFFVVEGWSKLNKAETFLHIHGAAAMIEPGDKAKIKLAAARACGHKQGRPKMARSIHVKPFTRSGPRYINYLMKCVRRHDDRLTVKRMTMSRSATQATKELWNAISGQ